MGTGRVLISRAPSAIIPPSEPVPLSGGILPWHGQFLLQGMHKFHGRAWWFCGAPARFGLASSYLRHGLPDTSIGTELLKHAPCRRKMRWWSWYIEYSSRRQSMQNVM